MGRREAFKTVGWRLPYWIGRPSSLFIDPARGRRFILSLMAGARRLAKRVHWRGTLALSALLVSFRGTLGPADLLAMLSARLVAKVVVRLHRVRGALTCEDRKQKLCPR
jgi:hypothetical protein